MDSAPSRRLRFRFFPEDDKALDDTLKLTNHASKSNVIRGALTFFDQAWSNKRAGFRVLYFRDGKPDRIEVLDAAVSRVRRKKRKEGEAPERSKTEKSIEIRLSHVDEERIDRLLAMEAAGTFSEVVRRAVRLYATVVARCKDGWEVAALSPSGDVLAMTVPGLGSEGQMNEVAVTRPDDVRAAGRAPAMAGGLSDVLPRSLVDSVRALAAREGCSADLLLVDMVRTETFARLRRLDDGAPILEMPVLETPELSSVEVMPESEPDDPAAMEEERAEIPDIDMAVIDEVSRTLDQMADNVEKVMQLVGETGRSKNSQGELTDLFLSTTGAIVGLDKLSPTERLFQRAQELNGRLDALVALTHRERKPRASRSTRTPAEKGGEDTTDRSV